MKIVVLVFLLLYYFCIGALALGTVGGVNPLEAQGYNITIELNDSEMQDDEIDTGGIFSTGVSFARFIGMVLFGYGIFPDAPMIISTIFALIQSCLTVFTVAFVMSMFWDG
jgi:hypothetical protein